MIGTLTLTDTNTYLWPTTINCGIFASRGNSSLASTNLIVVGDATLDISGEAMSFTLGNGNTLTNALVGAVVSGNINCRLGTSSSVTDGTNASFIQTDGTLFISASTVIKVNSNGAALTPGIYPVIAAVSTGTIGAVTGAIPPFVILDNSTSGTATLQTNLAAGSFLVVARASSGNPTSMSVTVTSSTLISTSPDDHLGWTAQSNAGDLSDSDFWFDISGSQVVTGPVIPINQPAPKVF